MHLTRAKKADYIDIKRDQTFSVVSLAEKRAFNLALEEPHSLASLVSVSLI